MQNQHENDELITGINVTPLVDITLVLLIIFMVTATFIMAPSIPVELPRATTGEPSPVTNIAVVITNSGELFLNGNPVTEGELRNYVKTHSTGELNAIIGADREAKHGMVTHIIDILRQEGVKKFAINVEGE
jgi:biopolymer transport protein ExbD